MTEFVDSRVAKHYWEDDINCATTTLNILAEHFGVELDQQVRHAAIVSTRLQHVGTSSDCSRDL